MNISRNELRGLPFYTGAAKLKFNGGKYFTCLAGGLNSKVPFYNGLIGDLARSVLNKEPYFLSENARDNAMRFFIDLDVETVDPYDSVQHDTMIANVQLAFLKVTENDFDDTEFYVNQPISRQQSDAVSTATSLLITTARYPSVKSIDGIKRYKFGYHLLWHNLYVTKSHAIKLCKSIIAQLEDAQLEPFSDAKFVDMIDVMVYGHHSGKQRVDASNVPNVKSGSLAHLRMPLSFKCDKIENNVIHYKLDSVYFRIHSVIDHTFVSNERFVDAIRPYHGELSAESDFRDQTTLERLVRFIKHTSINPLNDTIEPVNIESDKLNNGKKAYDRLVRSKNKVTVETMSFTETQSLLDDEKTPDYAKFSLSQLIDIMESSYGFLKTHARTLGNDVENLDKISHDFVDYTKILNLNNISIYLRTRKGAHCLLKGSRHTSSTLLYELTSGFFRLSCASKKNTLYTMGYTGIRLNCASYQKTYFLNDNTFARIFGRLNNGAPRNSRSMYPAIAVSELERTRRILNTKKYDIDTSLDDFVTHRKRDQVFGVENYRVGQRNEFLYL